MAKGLFDNHAPPMAIFFFHEASLRKALDDVAEEVGRGCEVEEIVAVRLMFLVNLVGQMWEPLEHFRPCTIFYYFQPQDLILGRPWTTTLPPLLVLYGVGFVGYLLALWTFRQRDLPAPL